MDSAAPRPAIDLGRLSPLLRQTCDEYCGSYRERLATMLRHGDRALQVSRMHARILDGLLGALFCAADAAVAKNGPTRNVALVAVGGYARGLVGLHSDVDVVFLCEDPSDPHVRALAEGLLYPLWDVGLEIGHAVRGVEETLALARQDIRTATTLLDMRRVAGARDLLEDLQAGARRSVLSGDGLTRFFASLEEDRQQRHERFGGSLYLLEPEVKLGCGGLRDLDCALWAAQARRGAGTREELVRYGALLQREANELENASEMLWQVRNRLHLRAGRRQDRLTFEDQEELAMELGFVDGVTLGVEQFMQAYYRHASVVERTAERMIARAREVGRNTKGYARESLGRGLLLFDGQVTFEDSAQLRDRPALALHLYDEVLERRVPVYSFARDAIARIAVDDAWAERLRANSEASAIFLKALSSTAETPVRRRSVVSELHEVGLLLAMIPEFLPVTGRVQHDVYHVYTVDVHSVAAVDRLRAIKRGSYANQLPLASRLCAELPRPAPLFLGLLLHDIGKAQGKDHSAKGALMARPIAERLGLSPSDVEHVVWLVEEHLSLYHWATRRDITDPTVVAEIAEHVGTLDRLRDLYLLTVADLSTTNPNAMTSWKARLLSDVYLAVSARLDGEERTSSERTREVRRRLLNQLEEAADVELEEMRRFVESMPDRYILANPEASILAHARAVPVDSPTPWLSVFPGPSPDTSELVLSSEDRPGLLADVTAVLAGQRLSIVNAQIYTRDAGGAFDVFHVRRMSASVDGPPVDEARCGRIRADLIALWDGKLDAETLLSRLKRPGWAVRHRPEVATEVRVDNSASSKFTVVDVFTRDRPALLHAIARVLYEQNLTIGLSKVNTEGERAADVFYVRGADGEKVRDPQILSALRTALYDALEEASEQ